MESVITEVKNEKICYLLLKKIGIFLKLLFAIRDNDPYFYDNTEQQQ
jgi:hypothetical protein